MVGDRLASCRKKSHRARSEESIRRYPRSTRACSGCQDGGILRSPISRRTTARIAARPAPKRKLKVAPKRDGTVVFYGGAVDADIAQCSVVEAREMLRGPVTLTLGTGLQWRSAR